MLNVMNFDNCIRLCNHHPKQDRSSERDAGFRWFGEMLSVEPQAAETREDRAP